MTTMSKTGRWAVSGTAAAALALAACSSNPNSAISKLPPAQAVSQSVGGLTAQPAIEVRLSLGVTAAQAQQLSKSSGPKAGALSQGTLFLVAASGHGENLDSSQAATDTSDSFDLGLQLPSGTPVELRYVGQALYLKADLPSLYRAMGQSPTRAQQFQNTLDQADTYVPGLKALGQGQWVEASQQSLQSLNAILKQYLGGSASIDVSGTLQKLLQQVQTSLLDNATFQNLGNQGGRTEYAMTVKVRSFLNQLLPAVQNDVNGLIPAGLGSRLTTPLGQEAGKVPARQTAVADLYVSGDKLQEADVDLTQFAGAHRPSFPVPLKAVFSTPSAVKAPAGAVPIDLSKLPSLLQGLMGEKS